MDSEKKKKTKDGAPVNKVHRNGLTHGPYMDFLQEIYGPWGPYMDFVPETYDPYGPYMDILMENWSHMVHIYPFE